MTLGRGTRLGPYQISGQIGAGGMGEVYRARDTRSSATWPSRCCRDDVASDPIGWRGSSAKREALAALNHPNIAAIYGVEQADGVSALVMELVEGPTLAERHRSRTDAARRGARRSRGRSPRRSRPRTNKASSIAI